MASSSSFKITTVGDAGVGKTSVQITYTQNEFPVIYEPTIFENYATEIEVDGNEYDIRLIDTAGDEGYERMRILSYPGTHCFVMCYSIANKSSYENVLTKWYPEIHRFSPSTPIVLVGLKKDLRIPDSEKYVTTIEATRLKKRIKAYAVVECSARKNDNVDTIFEEAVRAIINKNRGFCPLL